MSTDTLLCSVGLPWQHNAVPGQTDGWQVVQCTVMGTPVYLAPYNAHTASHRQVVQCTVMGQPVHPAPYNAHTVSHRQVVQCTVRGMPVHLSPYNAHTVSHRQVVQYTVMEPTVFLAPYNAHTALYQHVVQCTVMGTPPHWLRLSGENPRHADERRPQLVRRWAQCTGRYCAGITTTAHAAASHRSRLGLEVPFAFAGGFHTPYNTLEAIQ